MSGLDFPHPDHPLSHHILMVTSSVRNVQLKNRPFSLSPSADGCLNIPFGQGSVRRAAKKKRKKKNEAPKTLLKKTDRALIHLFLTF